MLFFILLILLAPVILPTMIYITVIVIGTPILWVLSIFDLFQEKKDKNYVN